METTDFFPGMSVFIEKTLDKNKSKGRRYTDIFNSTINLLELALQIFIVTTVRVYEERIIKEPDEVKKKTKPINEFLKNKYATPSLGTHSALARACFHLIDETAPIELLAMKAKLNEIILLGPIGKYLDELNKIYDFLENTDENISKTVDRQSSRRSIQSILNDFIAFRNDSAHLINIGNVIEDNETALNLNVDIWSEAFLILVNQLKPLLSLDYRQKTVDKIYHDKEIKMISIIQRTFSKGVFKESTEKTRLDEWYEDQWNEKSEIVLSGKTNARKSIDIFPFILLKSDNIYFYKKTRTSKYQYFSLSEDRTYSIPSKKKFNKILFKAISSSNSQAIFWADVAPRLNPVNNVKANIPNQGSTAFIGRKKQINKIQEEIIEIPNENGILYGPGGVGKTALLIQLSEKLYNTDTSQVLYDNIIWVSAKSNFYHWEVNSIISSPQQFESLQNILQIMLRFFDFEDVEEYSLDELKDLVFELLEENKVLLVLDNFETVIKAETDKIIDFSKEIKKHLKHLPNNFKIILTSRERIPSGYFQIKLEGLEVKESRMLIESIYERYKNANPPLTAEQCKLIHEATFGIPIVIKHCLGQLYEFQIPLAKILSELSEESNEVIKFSYSEILSHLKKDDCYLKILILLEILNEPISIRKIAIILELSAYEINKRITILQNFQCIDNINVGIEEKFRISNQLGLLVKSLIKENNDLMILIRRKISNNLTLEKRMDYAIEELEIIEVFNGYIEIRDFPYAEFFLKQEISKRPTSHLLRFKYALFLRDQKKELKQSIGILETLDSEICKSGKRDINILLALIYTYTLSDFPDYDKANIFCKDLLEISQTNSTFLFAAEFLINWSSALKNKTELDPIKELHRRSRYKELAQEGIKLIYQTKEDASSHKCQFLIAQAYYNNWETDKAKLHLEKAITLAQNDHVSLQKYNNFMLLLQKYNVKGVA